MNKPFNIQFSDEDIDLNTLLTTLEFCKDKAKIKPPFTNLIGQKAVVVNFQNVGEVFEFGRLFTLIEQGIEIRNKKII